MGKGDDYIEQLWEKVVDPNLKGDWMGVIFMRWDGLKKGPNKKGQTRMALR